MKRLILVLNIILSLQAFAHGDHDQDHSSNDAQSTEICNEVLQAKKGPIVVRHDGLSHEYAAQGLKEAIEARDVLHKLGVPTPPHQIVFAPERQLNILAATGLLPVPHALSGAEIYKAIMSKQGLGILEFAQPGGASARHTGGCSTCRSYYSNMTRLRDQRPIYLHVGGHNHVFQRSLLSRTRNVDPIAASDDFAKEMEKQYQAVSMEEVGLYYHYLHAMQWLQDYQGGTFAKPDSLTPQESAAKTVTAPQAPMGNYSFLRPEEKITQVPWEKTPSLLQFMAANMPAHAPEWKKELLRKYEMTVRTYPAVVNQKFVHEGWATYLMLLGQKHSNWTSDRDMVDFAALIYRVIGPQLQVQHPYSMGTHGFHHLYLKFMRRPELTGLTDLAKDILFVKYVDGLLPTMTDSDFITRVVDDEFVSRHNLSLVRQGTEEELAPSWRRLAEQGKLNPKDPPKGIIISKSADRVRRAINRRVGVKPFPMMEAVNPAISNPFQISQQQRLQEDTPLEPMSAALIFFAQTQVTGMPVSGTFLMSERWINPQAEKPGTLFVRMEVRPDGRVRFFKRNTLDILAKNPEESELAELAAHFQGGIDYYRMDQGLGYSDKINAEDQRRWEQMFPKMIDEQVAKANTERIPGLVDYAPTAARAIMMFSQMIKARFNKQMEEAFKGKVKLKFGPKGVRLPVIPSVPQLQYDTEHMQKANVRPPAPIDTIDNRIARLQIAPDADDGSLLGPVPGGSVGDAVKIPEGGQGQGQGGPEEGDGESDDNEVEVPSNLYRQMLMKHFEIPNPRETDGQTELPKDIPMGERRDSSEEPMWDRMVGDALGKAIAARRARGETQIIGHIPPAQLVREGFKLLDEDDYIIRSKREIMVPSFDAVVVVNIDTSPSMTEHRLNLVRNLVYNIRELFRAVYPNVKFHFVALSSGAKEFPENKIWTAKMSGGTNYAPALKETKKILSNYPRSQWNHYVIFAGDSELGDLDDFMKEFTAIKKTLQFFGLVVTQDPGAQDGVDANGLRAALEASKSDWKWIGISQVNDESEIFKGLSDLFPKSRGGR